MWACSSLLKKKKNPPRLVASGVLIFSPDSCIISAQSDFQAQCCSSTRGCAAAMRRHLLETELDALHRAKTTENWGQLATRVKKQRLQQPPVCFYIDFQWHRLTLQFQTVIIIEAKLPYSGRGRKEMKKINKIGLLLIQKSRATAGHRMTSQTESLLNKKAVSRSDSGWMNI